MEAVDKAALSAGSGFSTPCRHHHPQEASVQGQPTKADAPLTALALCLVRGLLGTRLPGYCLVHGHNTLVLVLILTLFLVLMPRSKGVSSPEKLLFPSQDFHIN